ncbi:MAG TPA: hypothetical protein VF548_13925 [Allosphingosinicella sp.]
MPNGVVIGRDSRERLLAARELDSAAASYSAWFPGKPAVAGLVLLDSSAARRASLVRGTSWTLTYDLASKPGMEGLSAIARPGPSNARDWARGKGPLLAARDKNVVFDVTRPGVLAHEICHRHAARAFAQAWSPSRKLPDMLDEVAAISCETEELKAGRLELFARLFADGKLIPWDGFLVTRHPLKEDPAMIRALAGLGKGAVAFDIKPGSSYELKVALFYAQAAAFGDFVNRRSCRGRQAIGNLLATYDPREGLDHWLRSSGARFCLPASVGKFEESFSQAMGQGAAGRRRPVG